MKKETLFRTFGSREWKDYPDHLHRQYFTESKRYFGNETEIFQDVVRQESHLYSQHKSFLKGELIIRVGGKMVDLAARSKPFQIPSWVEEDGIEFLKCKADGILLTISYYPTFDRSIRAHFDKKMNMLLACSCGIPRFNLRRLLHRVTQQFKIPVYVLGDNETWSYFSFSVLKRGTLGPDFNCPHAAVEDTRYLGLCASDLPILFSPEQQKRATISWRKHWSPRMDALRRYRCFREKQWRREFDQFEKQRGQVETGAVFGYLGTPRVLEYYSDKLKRRNWLA